MFTISSANFFVATIIAELFIAIMYVRNSSGYMSFQDIWNLSWKRVLSGIIMCLSVYLYGRIETVPIFIKIISQIVLGIILYSMMLLLLRDKMIYELIKEIKGLIGKIKR